MISRTGVPSQKPVSIEIGNFSHQPRNQTSGVFVAPSSINAHALFERLSLNNLTTSERVGRFYSHYDSIVDLKDEGGKNLFDLKNHSLDSQNRNLEGRSPSHREEKKRYYDVRREADDIIIHRPEIFHHNSAWRIRGFGPCSKTCAGGKFLATVNNFYDLAHKKIRLCRPMLRTFPNGDDRSSELYFSAW